MAREKNNFSRREFLSRAVSGMASIGFLGVSGRVLTSSGQKKLTQDPKKKIIYRTLGKTGIRLPIVNMGVMNSLDSELVKKSYEIGVRHFDTAAWYMRGRNEEMLGNAIKELNVRDKVIIGTKIYIPHQQREMSPEKAKEAYLKIVEESLKRLQTDYVDILYSHNVDSISWLNNPGIIEALLLLKKQGKARFIGFTTHKNMAECINEAVRTNFYEVILTVFNYALGDNKNLINALRNAASKGIGLMAMKTQCSQYWYRANVPKAKISYYEGKILHTAVLKWALQNDFITTAVPGYTTFEQMEEDFSVAYDLEYTEEEKKFLEDRKVKLAMKGYCQQCSRCLPSCPNGVDIPALMRTHMYAACYANFYQARDTLDEIPKGKGLDECASCSKCLARCVSQVDITTRIDELKMIYV